MVQVSRLYHQNSKLKQLSRNLLTFSLFIFHNLVKFSGHWNNDSKITGTFSRGVQEALYQAKETILRKLQQIVGGQTL